MSGKQLVVAPKQYELDLKIEKEVEVDGVGMGVLSDGTPYLTGRGLARMCGVAQNAIHQLTERWPKDPARPREKKIKKLLNSRGIDASFPCIAITKGGVTHHAYPDFMYGSA